MIDELLIRPLGRQERPEIHEINSIVWRVIVKTWVGRKMSQKESCHS